MLLLLEETARQDFSQLLVIGIGLLSVAGTFATVVAMFVSLKGKVENQSEDIKELRQEVSMLKKSLETLVKLEERIENMRAKR